MFSSKTIIILTSLLLAVTPKASAQGILASIGSFIDSMSVKGVDRNYVDMPERPWQIMVKGNMSQTDLRMHSAIPNASLIDPTAKGAVGWDPQIKTKAAKSVGAWIGYRGYGIGYMQNIDKEKSTLFTIGVTGGSYGVNLRIHKFETQEPKVEFSGTFLNENTGEYENLTEKGDFYLWSPIKVRTLTLDAYYLFNGKHFSYSAAYDQSVIQKHSAGSFMVGAMYHYSMMNYAEGDNADFIIMMNDIGKLKQWQANIGAGYAYNWVPCKGLLVNAMAMPMLTLVNRAKAWRYTSELRDAIMEDPYADEDSYPNPLDCHLSPLTEPDPLGNKRVTTKNSKISLAADTRISVTYQWDRFFVNANAAYYFLPYHSSNYTSHLHDWYVNASIGIRI